jgi:hypothetical protein
MVTGGCHDPSSIFLHYRVVREAITVIVTIGTALLLSYLILWMKF